MNKLNDLELSDEDTNIQQQQPQQTPWSDRQRQQFIQYIEQNNITKLNDQITQYLQNYLQKTKQQIQTMFNQSYVDENVQKQIISIAQYHIQTRQQVDWKQISKKTHKGIKSVIHSYENYYDNCPQEILDKIKHFIQTSITEEINWKKMQQKLRICDLTLQRLVKEHKLQKEQQWTQDEIQKALNQGQQIINDQIKTLDVQQLFQQYPNHRLSSIIQYLCINPKQIKFQFD